MFTNDRNAYRQHFFLLWQKYQKKLPLETAEIQLIEIILQHPEYQVFLENPKQFANQEFALEENPFFHMSLHLAVREQLITRRPAGIEEVYEHLMVLHHDQMQVEHLMMECLVYFMQLGQQTGEMAGDEEYLRALRAIR